MTGPNLVFILIVVLFLGVKIDFRYVELIMMFGYL